MVTNLFAKSIKSIESCIDLKSHETRRKAKIVIVDDEGLEESLLIVLNNNGFIIETMQDVTNLKHLAAYDIILCDIRGVGLSISPDFEGAGLLKAIKEEYPVKYIISYTGSDIDPKYNRMLKYADNSIAKDADKNAWIELLSDAVSVVLDPIKQWSVLHKYLVSKGLSTSYIIKIEDNYVRKLLQEITTFPSNKIVRSIAPEITGILKDIVIPVASVVLKKVV